MNLGIITGLKREKEFFENKENIFITSGYSKNSIYATKKLLRKKIDLIINFGYAGSLDKSVRTGDIIIPRRVVNASGNIYKVNTKYFNFFRKKIRKETFTQDLYTSTNIENDLNSTVLKIKKKKKIFSFVDMEAIHVCKVAAENNVPFIVIKVIFDDLDFKIPKFITSCIDENGEIKFLKLFVSFMLNPKRIGEAIFLNRKYKSAKISAKEIVDKIVEI